MKGTILTTGIISGEDGNRYNFVADNVQNLDGKEIQDIVNAEVDFVIKDEKAVEIFITNTQKQNTTLTNKVISNDVSAVKTKMFIGLGLRLGTVIPAIGVILTLAGLVFQFIAVSSANKLASSKTLLKNFTISFIIAFISGIVSTFGITGVLMASLFGSSRSFNAYGGYSQPSIDWGMIIFLALIVIALAIVSIIFMKKYYAELSIITEQQSFTTVFYLYAIGMLTTVILIGGILIFIAFILELMAWSNVEKINKST